MNPTGGWECAGPATMVDDVGGSIDTCGAGFPQDWAAALRGCGHIVAMNSAEVGAFLARLAAGLDAALTLSTKPLCNNSFLIDTY